MKHDPLVSVFIPAYNSERYVQEALDSVLSQTYRNLEVIVSDGGSADSTVPILRACKKKDPRVRVFLHARQTITQGRNEFFHQARGDFFTFLDSDDVYEPTKVEEEVRSLMGHPEDAAVYCNIKYFFDEDTSVFFRHRFVFYSGDVFEKLLEKMFITNTAVMMRRSVVQKLGDYDESLGIVEDWDYFLRMSFQGCRIGFLDKPLVRYRVRFDSHTQFTNQLRVQESAVKIFENLEKRMSDEQRKRYRINMWVFKRKIRYGLMLLSVGRRREALRLIFFGAPSFLEKIAYGAAFLCASLFPASFLRFILERAWNKKRETLFIKNSSPD